jgi:hypothetical protein
MIQEEDQVVYEEDEARHIAEQEYLKEQEEIEPILEHPIIKEKINISICIPIYKQVPSDSVVSLLDLACEIEKYNALPKGKYNFYLSTIDSCFVDVARNNLLQTSEKLGCKYLLWIDSDHKFTGQTIMTFVERYFAKCNTEKDILGGVYRNRTHDQVQYVSYVFTETDIPMIQFPDLDYSKKDKFMEFDMVGLGLCIMPITAPQEVRAVTGFAFHSEGVDGRIIGEDTYFFWKLKGMNKRYRVMLDLNTRIGHVGGILW